MPTKAPRYDRHRAILLDQINTRCHSEQQRAEELRRKTPFAEAALCGRSQFASKPTLRFPGFHRVVPFGDDLVDVAAQLALEGANVEA